MFPSTSTASRTTGSRRFSIDIDAMCSAWTKTEARAEMEAIWHPEGVWAAFVDR